MPYVTFGVKVKRYQIQAFVYWSLFIFYDYCYGISIFTGFTENTPRLKAGFNIWHISNVVLRSEIICITVTHLLLLVCLHFSFTFSSVCFRCLSMFFKWGELWSRSIGNIFFVTGDAWLEWWRLFNINALRQYFDIYVFFSWCVFVKILP